MVSTQPKLSPTVMTSPGLIDLSASRMMPLTRFDTIFCRPKPMPTPTAPEKIASAEKSMPTEPSTISTAKVTSATRASLPSSTWIDGVRSSIGAQPRVEEVAQRDRAPQRDQEQRRGLEREQRRDPQAADHDAGAVEPGDHLVEQADDAERRDRPRDDRHHAVEERVADQARGDRDHHPGGREAGGDADQVGAAGQRHVPACRCGSAAAARCR